MENDTQTGGDDLTLDQAAAAYAKTLSTEVSDDHSEDEVTDESETTDDELQASDEDEGEDADGETTSEEDPEQDEESEPESDQGRFVADNAKVRLADGTVTTIHELKRGFLREADYTRKTQENSARLKDTETATARIKERETQLEQQSTYVADLIRSIIPQVDPEWADPQSPKYDPAKYIAQQAAQQQWAQHLAYLDGQRQQTEQERKAAAEKELSEKAGTEWNALLEKVPAFKDKAKWDAFAKDANKYGAEYGFKPEELRQLAYDHRQIAVLRKAILWDKLQASKPKVQQKVENRPPVQKGGKRLNPAEHKARQASDALARLKQQGGGSVEDVTAAYIASLNKG